MTVFDYELSKHNLRIYNSYKIRGREFDVVLGHILFDNSYSHRGATDVFYRSAFSLKMEWACHNFLYKIGVARGRTKDVDLDYPCGWREPLYKFFGMIVWIFVR